MIRHAGGSEERIYDSVLDPVAKLHARSRIPVDSMSKSIAGSIIPPDLAITWAGPRIPKDLTTKRMA